MQDLQGSLARAEAEGKLRLASAAGKLGFAWVRGCRQERGSHGNTAGGRSRAWGHIQLLCRAVPQGRLPPRGAVAAPASALFRRDPRHVPCEVLVSAAPSSSLLARIEESCSENCPEPALPTPTPLACR